MTTTNNETQATETTTETVAPVAKKPTLKDTVASVKARLVEDGSYLEWAICALAARQTEDELVSKETKYKNRQGFASSKAVWGTKYAEHIAAGGTIADLGPEHVERAQAICTFHAKQLARIQLG